MIGDITAARGAVYIESDMELLNAADAAALEVAYASAAVVYPTSDGLSWTRALAFLSDIWTTGANTGPEAYNVAVFAGTLGATNVTSTFTDATAGQPVTPHPITTHFGFIHEKRAS